jgi:hypothetical protein
MLSTYMACATRIVICVLCSKLNWLFYGSKPGFETYMDKILTEELSLTLRKTCGLDGISNECLRHLSRTPLVHLTHLFNHCFWLPKPRKEAKVIALLKPGKDPKFLQNLCPISFLPTTGKLFKKVILKIVKMHIEERGLLGASKFGFRASHSTTLQCTRLTDVTLNFNNNMATAAVFLDIEKAVMFLSIYPACGRMKQCGSRDYDSYE